MKKEHQYKATHIADLTNPDKWVKSAVDLAKGAKALRPAVDQEANSSPKPCTDIFMMLCSYAIENLMKALVIVKEKEGIRNQLHEGVQFRNIIKEGHKLDKLAIRAGAHKIEKEYCALLKRLSRSATWFARYPAPLFPDEYETDDFFGLLASSPNFVPMGAYCSNDINDIENILKDLYIEIENIKGQPDP
jgi:hypothetical protein